MSKGQKVDYYDDGKWLGLAKEKKSVQRYITNSPHPKTMDLLCDHRPLLTCNQQQREGAGKDQQADSDLWATRHNLEPNIKHTIFTSRGPASTRHTAAPSLDTWRQRFVGGGRGKEELRHGCRILCN